MCCDKFKENLIWISVLISIASLHKFVRCDYEDSHNIFYEKPCCNHAPNSGQYKHQSKHQTKGN